MWPVACSLIWYYLKFFTLYLTSGEKKKTQKNELENQYKLLVGNAKAA